MSKGRSSYNKKKTGSIELDIDATKFQLKTAHSYNPQVRPDYGEAMS